MEMKDGFQIEMTQYLFILCLYVSVFLPSSISTTYLSWNQAKPAKTPFRDQPPIPNQSDVETGGSHRSFAAQSGRGVPRGHGSSAMDAQQEEREQDRSNFPRGRAAYLFSGGSGGRTCLRLSGI